MPLDAAVGITAAVAFGSKFVERSKFSSRHDGIYDKELEKSLKAAESFHNIPKEDVDFFEAEEYNLLHSKSMNDLTDYRSAQDEYKEKEWYRGPRAKFQLRGRVREAKRRLQSSVSRERSHVDELETYSRSAHSRSGSVRSFASDASRYSGLDLDRSLPYRTDSVSIRAVNHSPPSASLEDVSHDETRDVAQAHVSEWLLSLPSPWRAEQLAESLLGYTPNPGSPAVSVEDSGVCMPPSFENNPKPQPTFLTKLYALLECPENHHMIHWDSAGEYFIVERPEQFALHVLPDVFGLSSFASFSQDLMTYGFTFKVDVNLVDTRIWAHPILNRHSPHQKLLQISAMACDVPQLSLPTAAGVIASSAGTTSPAPLLLNKPFRCPKPNCNRSYKQANGLKYHLTHGSCNFAPMKDLERVKDLLERKKREKEQPHQQEGQQGANLTRSTHLGSTPTSSTAPIAMVGTSSTLRQTQPPTPSFENIGGAPISPTSILGLTYNELSNISESDLREVEREAERRLRPFACGVGDCQRRYKNMNGLRYHYQHSGDHGAAGLALLASRQHKCLGDGNAGQRSQ